MPGKSFGNPFDRDVLSDTASFEAPFFDETSPHRCDSHDHWHTDHRICGLDGKRFDSGASVQTLASMGLDEVSLHHWDCSDHMASSPSGTHQGVRGMVVEGADAGSWVHHRWAHHERAHYATSCRSHRCWARFWVNEEPLDSNLSSFLAEFETGPLARSVVTPSIALLAGTVATSSISSLAKPW